MRFRVPKFIEREPRIIGPLTFKQLIFIIAMGVVLVMLRFILPFKVFILSALVLIGLTTFLSFAKIEGFSVPHVLLNFFNFLVSPKMYLWKKESRPFKIIRKRKAPKKEKGPRPPILKVAEKSRLSKMATRIEIGI